MKRNKNLIELSRDHHHGLLLGWKIKEGLKRNVSVGELANYVSHFAGEALIPHFEEEENQVLIYLDSDDEYRKRTIREHSEIRDLINNLPENDKDILLKLADLIEAHIRFEERELFPYIEKTLSVQQLDEMGELIADIHQPYSESYPNEFWAK
ncbi:hemerythrin domain-containing protein [Pedobacter sp. P351]|uniref:hemerythrin domain-containing protein n=1 Tax=Pedobacter superstes TaxID=3133441 RepID=UPI0030AE4ED8